MLFALRINQKMAHDENISINAAIVFETIYQLSRLSYATIKVVDGKNYFVTYKSYILKHIPLFKIKSHTLSVALGELEACGLLESIDKSSEPAYCFTPKADKYITSSFAPANEGADAPQKKKREPLFSLKKALESHALTPEYFKLLKNHALDICKEKNIDKDEFLRFIDHHAAKGSKFKNWLSAWRNWVRNYQKWNPKDGEKNINGLYQ